LGRGDALAFEEELRGTEAAITAGSLPSIPERPIGAHERRDAVLSDGELAEAPFETGALGVRADEADEGESGAAGPRR
jgi:hypothetical protein